MSKGTPQVRYAEVERETRETRVRVVLDFDGGTRRDISTGIGFLDHMLGLMAFHGQFDIGVQADGDLMVDDHHTVEDVGIVLGKAMRQALAESDPIERYGDSALPMDEALVLVALDISGRGHLFYDCTYRADRVGGLSTQNIQEFFRSLCLHGGLNVHIRQLAGENDHHIAEATFKAFGRALRNAVKRIEAGRGSTSTKGRID
ncbi:MAG: imidazoleglycerol-phosphate dehydratase HisB [Armatimonadetes bacterium]|nr:imidazoleglycerol-phosphate dehydratase HisB [Armatimonadota bacterium]